MRNPLNTHWSAVKRILRYLRGTTHYGLSITRLEKLDLTGYSDSKYAQSLDDRQSVTGFCIYRGKNLITWCSKKQFFVSRSIAEAEYRSLANTTAEILWLQSLLKELKIQFTRTPIVWCVNTSTISMSANLYCTALTHKTQSWTFSLSEKR